MSGPIVRSGPSPEFSKNWESVFGKKQAGAKSSASTKSRTQAKKAATKKKKKSGK